MRERGIFFAADIEDRTNLLSTIRSVSPFVEGIKLGNTVLYAHGWKIIEEIKKISDKPIIADLKLMDIPEIARRLTLSAVNAGADGLMICGIAGEETIDECRAFSKDKMLFVFTEFTHETGLIDSQMADGYIQLALKYRCDGIQVPGTKHNRIKEVREKIGNNMIIISCGVGAQGPLYGSAIKAGANYEIIGRAIYTSNNPELEAKKAQDQIRNG